MTLVEKLADAASMFWQALDDRERLLVIYGLAYALSAAVVTVANRERRRREDKLIMRIREELIPVGN